MIEPFAYAMLSSLAGLLFGSFIERRYAQQLAAAALEQGRAEGAAAIETLSHELVRLRGEKTGAQIPEVRVYAAEAPFVDYDVEANVLTIDFGMPEENEALH